MKCAPVATIVASQLRQNQRVMDDFYSKWTKPFLTAYGSEDALMAGRDEDWLVLNDAIVVSLTLLQARGQRSGFSDLRAL